MGTPIDFLKSISSKFWGYFYHEKVENEETENIPVRGKVTDASVKESEVIYVSSGYAFRHSNAYADESNYIRDEGVELRNVLRQFEIESDF